MVYVGAALLGGVTELTTGALGTPLDKTPEGSTLTASQAAWTGTDSQGAFNVACADWTSASASDTGEVGTVGGGSFWTAATARSCDQPRHVYCFEK